MRGPVTHPTTSSPGLHDIGPGCWAWTQRDGSWGWSNAGLVTDGDRSLLVDTLFDARLTATMLAAMRDVAPAARELDTVVNTHGNGDHCWGNQLVGGAEIIATDRAAAEIREAPPARAATLLKAARVASALGPLGAALGKVAGALGASDLAHVVEARDYVQAIFGEFDFGGVTLTPPTRTFAGELNLQVGDKAVDLIDVGPAHTQGDLLVHVPADRVMFTGDILFIGGHPIVWEGPVSNWVRACDRILAADVDVIVPGHGPLADKAGVRRVREYLLYLEAEARARHVAGLSALDAARDIAWTDFSSWTEAERVVVNVYTVYRELDPTLPPLDTARAFAWMSRLWRDRRRA